MNAIKNITVTDNIKNETYNLTTYQVDSVDINDIERSYIGATGCACGCGGDYIEASDNMSLTQRRLNKIITNIDTDAVEFFASGAEWVNQNYTRVTRIFWNDGISYEYDRYRGFSKTIKTIIDNA